MATTAVIIPLRHGTTSLETTLDAVSHNRSAGGDLEVIVVGAASPSLSLPPAGDRFRLRPVPRAVESFARACNAGAWATSAEYVVFLDPATSARAGWLDALLDHAAARPEAALIGSKLIDADATVRHAGVVIGQDRYPRPLYSGFPADHPAVNKSRRVQIVNLEGALIRRGAFEQLGGFDADFSGGFEDVDLCLRLAELGHEIHYCHRSVLFQANRATRRWGTALDEGFATYRRRWAHRVSPDDLRYLIEDGLLNVGYGPNHEMRVAVSPVLGPPDEAPLNPPGDRLVAVPSRSLIELMTRTIDLAREVQGIEGRMRDRFDELSARIQVSPRRDPEQESRASHGEGKNGDVPAAQLRGTIAAEDTVRGHEGVEEDDETAAGAHTVPSASPMGALDGWERSRIKRISYSQMIRRIREVVDASLMPTATVIVVSKGDERLLRLGSRRGWHFPRAETGEYAGYHPADSQEAIAHLEKLRGEGGDFLLFPSTAFWWLGYYRDFQKHLESRYPCVGNDRSCLIYQLTTSSNGRH